MRNPIDALLDPRPGDRLKIGKVRVRVLPCKVHGNVFYEQNNKPHSIDKLGWIDWCDAMGAEVLHVAQEGGEG